jgi:hypothetical protein
MSEEERQAFDLADAIEALKAQYPDIPPELDQQMRSLIGDLRLARVGRLAGQAMAVIGETHGSIRRAYEDLRDQVIAMYDETAVWRAESEVDIAALAAEVAALSLALNKEIAARLAKGRKRPETVET